MSFVSKREGTLLMGLLGVAGYAPIRTSIIGMPLNKQSKGTRAYESDVEPTVNEKSGK